MVDADRVRLPVPPGIVRKVTLCLAAEDPDVKRLWALVGQDPALLCNLFRAANSAFFVGLHKTVSIEEAVARLGIDKACQVVERACREGGEGGPQGELLSRYMPSLWQHAQGCAVGAHWLAMRCNYEPLAEQAYLAGLLHDIGKQFLLAAMEEISSSGEFGVILSDELVREVLTSMHVEQGLRLFEEWNLSDIYTEVVSEHHDEDLNPKNILIALVKLANKGCRKAGLGLTHQPDIVLPTTGEAQFLGIDELALAEFEIKIEDQFLGGQPGAAAQ